MTWCWHKPHFQVREWELLSLSHECCMIVWRLLKVIEGAAGKHWLDNDRWSYVFAIRLIFICIFILLILLLLWLDLNMQIRWVEPADFLTNVGHMIHYLSGALLAWLTWLRLWETCITAVWARLGFPSARLQLFVAQLEIAGWGGVSRPVILFTLKHIYICTFASTHIFPLSDKIGRYRLFVNIKCKRSQSIKVKWNCSSASQPL